MKIKTIFPVTLFVAAFWVTSASGEYINQFNPTTGNYYALTMTAEHYLDARAEANATGNHLVTVNDAAENTWLYNAFGTIAANQGARLWVGFTDEVSEGTFVWDNGEAATFTSWDPPSGEPNGGVLENYTEIITISSSLGNWNDNNEDAMNFGITESASPITSPVPEPRSGAMMTIRLPTHDSYDRA